MIDGKAFARTLRAFLLTDAALHLWWLTNSIEDNEPANDENENCL